MAFSYTPINSDDVDWSVLFATGETLGRELIRIEGTDLDQSRLIWEVMMVSLFSDARVGPEEVGPGESRGGWWGAAVGSNATRGWGSRLWLLPRAAPSQETALLARDYALEALAWLTEEGLADKVEADASIEAGVLTLNVSIARGAELVDVSFADLWRILDAA